jgi:hypothetical protein
MRWNVLSVQFLYCLAVLPLAFAFASRDGHLHWTRASALSIVGAEVFIVISSAVIAMCAAYAVFAVTRNYQAFARLVRFGTGLFPWFLFLMLIAALLMVG